LQNNTVPIIRLPGTESGCRLSRVMLRVVRLALACSGLLAVGCGSSAGDQHSQSTGLGGANGGGFASGAGRSGAGGSGSGGHTGSGGQSSAGEQAGGTAGSAGTDAAGGLAGAATFPPRPVCGGSISPGNERWCVGIENVTLSKGEVSDANGDGLVSPGEEASVDIIMRNDGPDGYNDPCVGLLADNPAVTIVGGEAHDNPAWNFFGIPAGQRLTVAMTFRLDESIPRGARIRFLAWYAVLKASCTNGNEIEFDLDVE
jgi:hypothetical protein